MFAIKVTNVLALAFFLLALPLLAPTMADESNQNPIPKEKAVDGRNARAGAVAGNGIIGQPLPPRMLQDTASARGSLGDRCSEENPCQDIFECTGLGVILGDRCVPMACYKNDLQAFQEQFDMDAYRKDIWQQAGITQADVENEIEQQMKGEQQTPSLRVNRPSMLFRNHTTGSLPTLASLQALQKTIEANPTPILELQTILNRCNGLAATTTSSSRAANKTSGDAHLTNFFGLHVEGGILADISWDFLWALSASPFYNFQRMCVGAEAGGGVEVSYVIGNGAPYYTISADKQLKAASFVVDADLGLIYGMGLQLGVNFQGVFMTELTVGVGFGFGIGGAVCFPIN